MHKKTSGGLLAVLVVAAPVFAAFSLPSSTAADAPADSLLSQATSATGIEMILVAPGTFMMGSPPSEPERDDHELQHQVTLSRGFWLGKNEVTQRQWQAVMGNNPSKLKGEDFPVEKVNWYDCVIFCNALSELEGLTPAYRISGESVTWIGSADGYRLPTEAEWEYACRAGTTGPFAGDLDEMAIYALNSGRKTRSVGTRKPNSWGFHDMHGNVLEWVWDRYMRDYGASWVFDPTGPDEGLYRIERGGSWHYNPRGCRSASRATDIPGARSNSVGFRLSRWIF
jgi:formylglycine-generating enzyme required for sulfatase activity